MLNASEPAKVTRRPPAPGGTAHGGPIALAMLGVLIAVLSFLRWIEFPGSTRPDLHGHDMDVITGVGDGHMTAAFGLVILTSSVVLWWRWACANVTMPAVVLAGLGVFTIAAAAATRQWQTNRDYSDIIYPVDGNPTVALLLLAALGVTAALLALLLATLNLRGDDQPVARVPTSEL